VGVSHSWVVRTWWVLEYLGTALLLQALTRKPEGILRNRKEREGRAGE
jgi:hypothetical protein